MDIAALKDLITRREELDSRLEALTELQKLASERDSVDAKIARLAGAPKSAAPLAAKRSVTCRTCQQTGHTARTCPSRDKIEPIVPEPLPDQSMN
ncbi:MAG: CCHC-type zinc finger protein [Alphaproteobacteria bacterium]|nr:CCHC-type zinc finger protein [Alphaproteobacteria bacterium]